MKRCSLLPVGILGRDYNVPTLVVLMIIRWGLSFFNRMNAVTKISHILEIYGKGRFLVDGIIRRGCLVFLFPVHESEDTSCRALVSSFNRCFLPITIWLFFADEDGLNSISTNSSPKLKFGTGIKRV
ncbi:hypothetical protein REPUB_Repub12eG0144100 [Reevesia pubescens]